MILLLSLGYGFSFLSENVDKLGLDFIFESSTHCSYNIQRPEINKQLLDEVEHDILNLSKPRSVLSAEAEGWGR